MTSGGEGPDGPGGELTPTIRTPDRRLRVFVSSTLAELAPERAAVRATIEGLRLTPVLFELGARPHPPRALYRAYLEPPLGGPARAVESPPGHSTARR